MPATQNAVPPGGFPGGGGGADLSTLSDEELAALSHMQDAQQQAEGQQAATQLTHSVSGSGGSWREYDPARGMSPLAQLGAGFDEGLVSTGMHAGNLVGAVSDPELKEYEHQFEPLNETPMGNAGSFAGQSAPFMVGGEAASLAPGVGPAIRSAGPIMRGAGEGATYGAIQSEPGERVGGTVWGGVGGAAFPTAANAAKMLAWGIPRTAAADELIQRGVRLTPGQMNPTGFWNKIEENLRSVPFLGTLIENPRTAAWGDLQRQAIQEASAPGFAMPKQIPDPKTGKLRAPNVQEMYDAAQASYKPLYDQASGFPVTPSIWHPGANAPLDAMFNAAAQRAGVGASRSVRDSAQDFLQGQLQAFGDKAKAAGGWKSEDLIALRSRINEEMRSAGVDQDGRRYRDLLSAARDNVTQALESQLPPQASSALRVANNAYPKLAIIRDAIKSGGDQAGNFTPAQFSASVRRATDTGEYAAGGGLLRDYSQPGREIFTERNPKTGATLGTVAGLGGLAAAGHAVPHVGVPAGAAGFGLLGTETGRSFLRGTTPLQRYAQRAMTAGRSLVPDDLANAASTVGGGAARVGGAAAMTRARTQSQADQQAQLQ